MNHADVIKQVCELLANASAGEASSYLVANYPAASEQTKRSTWSKRRVLGVFMRDRFTDRYFGQRMIFPGTLRALSLLIPEHFPYHQNWKQDVTHPAYWELSPTIDHVTPLAMGGKDVESNVVTTSMVRNAAKANFFREDLGWPCSLASCADNWDGLMPWFMDAYQRSEILQADAGTRGWYQAAKGCEASTHLPVEGVGPTRRT